MKVIVTTEYEMNTWRNVSVRKCPPNYKTQEGECICELEDYSEEDIKEYFEIETKIPDEDEGVHEC